MRSGPDREPAGIVEERLGDDAGRLVVAARPDGHHSVGRRVSLRVRGHRYGQGYGERVYNRPLRTTGGMSEWLKESGCKPDGYAYAGSNPAPPTTRPEAGKRAPT